MTLSIKILWTALVAIFLLGGCSKSVDEYNKPAIYWYGRIVEYVSKGELEKADGYYSSLQGEHIGSPLLPEATMILAIAHLHYEEYLLSEHFLNEYIKRYATINEKEAAEFLKIKAKYMALPNPRRDQALINQAIREADRFKRNYPNSMYYSVVDTMQTRLYMADAALNESIADLYDRIDKPRSAQFYREIKPQPWIKWDEINRANTPWYREWFEGDGTSSWYGSIVPDTQSVVSRNSVKSQKIKNKLKKELPKESQLSTYKQNELKKAQDLRDKGIIDDAELEKLKDKILK
ncbi:MAG: outer membrane protein assembly factor BamD [Epsilonproteobacteria bacterium]|nr:outer membrane protein assembly factor BamD [Campylobacterota bacterium]